MNLIQQPLLIATTPADNAVGMGILLVMFAMIIAGVALRSLGKRARGQWMTFGCRTRILADNQRGEQATDCVSCTGN